MAKVDLHVHTIHSEHPSDWVFRKFDAGESYTDPLAAFQSASARGMDYFTLTDHNHIEGCLLLQQRYPQQVFTSVETTAAFPDDGCQSHVLVYGLSPDQFDAIQMLRKNIYDLRDYLLEQQLAHSLAHPTYSVNGRLTVDHLEKYLLLFDVFEAINGGRGRPHNEAWMHVMNNLTPAFVEDLYRKHRIETASQTPWIKGLTAGSDDHANVFIGHTYTTADAADIGSFLAAIRNRQTQPQGRHNDFRSLAFMAYKIAYDYSKHRRTQLLDSPLSEAMAAIFEGKSPRPENRLKLFFLDKLSRGETNSVLLKLVRQLGQHNSHDPEGMVERSYDTLANFADEAVQKVVVSIGNNLQGGKILELINDTTSIFPGIIVSLPFLSTLQHINQGRGLLKQIEDRFLPAQPRKPKRVAWFTDTLNDLNGVSATLKTIGWLAYVKGYDLKIVTSLRQEDLTHDMPPNLVNLPHVHEFSLPYYEAYKIKIPSVLHSLNKIAQIDPDEIYISTPGPLGLMGLLASRILHTRSIGVYHTDFARQVAEIVEDESLVGSVEGFSRWFYSLMDEIRVPTGTYIDILSRRGLDLHKMRLFRRGIDCQLFRPIPGSKRVLESNVGLRKGFNLLYAGRISRDKGLDLLATAFLAAKAHCPDINLIVAGDGPYLSEFQSALRAQEGVYFLGRVSRSSLPEIYSAADLFVFPSTTDTFGMVVLEAQSCGLPVLVSDVGGPQEIVEHGLTGFVLSANTPSVWAEQIITVRRMHQTDEARYRSLQTNSRNMVLRRYDWEPVLFELLGPPRDDYSAQPPAALYVPERFPMKLAV